MEALPLSEYGSFIRVEPYPRPRPAADEAECGALCDELLEVLFAERNMVAAFNLPYPEKRKIVREYMNRRFQFSRRRGGGNRRRHGKAMVDEACRLSHAGDLRRIYRARRGYLYRNSSIDVNGAAVYGSSRLGGS